MDWFLYDIGLRHERVKSTLLALISARIIFIVSSELISSLFEIYSSTVINPPFDLSAGLISMLSFWSLLITSSIFFNLCVKPI